MYEIKPYAKEHLFKVKIDRAAKEMVEFIGADALSESFSARGPAFTAFADGEVIGMAGINIMWKGVGEAWAMFGASYQEHGVFLYRSTVRYLKQLPIDLNLQRLQAVVMKGHWAGIRWINHLGFEYEGDMEKYFNGRTYLRYAKIFNGAE